MEATRADHVGSKAAAFEAAIIKTSAPIEAGTACKTAAAIDAAIA